MLRRHKDEDDQLDGLCGTDVHQPTRPDEDTDGIVLFADVDPNDAAAVEQRELEYVALFAPELQGFTKADFDAV